MSLLLLPASLASPSMAMRLRGIAPGSRGGSAMRSVSAPKSIPVAAGYLLWKGRIWKGRRLVLRFAPGSPSASAGSS